MDVLTIALDCDFVTTIDAACWDRAYTYHRRNGATAQFRPCDLKWSSQPNRNYWYACASVKWDGKPFLVPMQRLLTECPSHLLADHKDGDTLRNVMDNLRVVTHAQNAANSRLYKNSKSPYRGITFRARQNKWQAQIHFGGKNGGVKALGMFDTAEEAARSFDLAAIEMFGEFARLNFPLERTSA